MRTHTCGALNSSHLKQKVSLCGWLEFQRMNCFAVLRDGYGSTQIIIPENRRDLAELLKTTPLESVVSVQGVVERRPDNQIRKDSPTGEVEVLVNNFNILNAVKYQLPFNVRNYSKASENLRIKHRYLDLRYPEMQRNLRERSRFLMKMRNFLSEQEDFVEVETPTLFKKTPGGAQEFIVPTKNPGEFFSLVQSPQQLKQLLMIGSLDKYFQIARCYRDEGARPDRQPEFTQLDLEMSFCSANHITDLIERLLVACWPKPIKHPFMRMTYADALKYYGTDQPDISFNCLISEVKSIFNRKHDGEKMYAVKIPLAGIYFNNTLKKELAQVLKGTHAEMGILNYLAESCESLEKSLSRFGIHSMNFIKEFSIKPGDIVFVTRGKEKDALLALGKCRVWYLRWLRSEGKTGDWDSENKGKFTWVIDFPLCEASDDGNLKSVHHPFTMPHPEDIHLLDTNLLEVRSLHYDLVLDGYEVGGGSIRIHDPDLQESIFSRLGISSNNLQHIIDALSCGAPPHGGIALGVDRLIALMVGAKSIRDVIAFPKTADGKDPLSGAPSTISQEELNYYNISVVKS